VFNFEIRSESLDMWKPLSNRIESQNMSAEQSPLATISLTPDLSTTDTMPPNVYRLLNESIESANREGLSEHKYSRRRS
jgi:hypothetical protein